jgi:4-amino-4-deoxy-L-arabinose transferase-like glycosyltransferase
MGGPASGVSGAWRFRWIAAPWAVVLAFVGMAALRIVAPASDAYSRLDWSAGLLTDEGFYSHNARNVVLFGHARTDDFNNMLVSPLLHALQVGVFRVFGPGVVPLRMISVVCSLFTLLLLWSALRPVFGRGVAFAAVCFLGFDHVAVLYHRLGLMDTPASLPATAALWAFSRAALAEGRVRSRWLCVVGLLLGLTLAVRSLCAYLAPAPLIALWAVARAEGRPTADRAASAKLWALVLGPFALAVAAYGAFWWLPHRAELAVMNRYYLYHQLLPGSPAHLWANVTHAILGDYRGLFPYLFRHTPAVFVLALAWLAGAALRTPREDGGYAARAVETYVTAWLLLGWTLLAVVAYSPSRYYVSTYPALAAVAALGLRDLPRIWERIWRPDGRARVARALLAWLVAYHAVEGVAFHRGFAPRFVLVALLYAAPTLLAALSVTRPVSSRVGGLQVGRAAAVLLLVGWAGVNAAWLTDWATHIRYTQLGMSRWLSRNLPRGSVLLGDVAPGVSMDARFVSVNIIPRLCNDVRPVERFAGRPRFAVILDGRWKEAYWLQRYPALVRAERRILLRRVLRWDIGVYAVD